MRIRKLKDGEKGSTRRLYEEIFSEDSPSFVDYYYTEKTKDNTIYVVEEEGGMRAMLHLNPYTLMVNGREEPSHYIVAVATEEAYRKRGYMAALLKTALRDMYRAGEPFTFLMPAAEGIYLPHGFSTVYEQERRYFRGEEELPGGWSARKALPADAADIADMAESELKGRYKVYAKRDQAYYERLIREYESDGGCLMVCEQEGRIVDCLPAVEELPEERPKIMVRPVNVKRLLLLLELNYLTAVCFQVTDPIIPENNQVFMMTGTEFSGVMLMEGKLENSEGTLTVEALTKLVFGRISPDDIEKEKGVRVTERMKEELKKIVPLSPVYLNEVV